MVAGARPGEFASITVSPAKCDRNSIAAWPSMIGMSVPETNGISGPVGKRPGPETTFNVTGGEALTGFPEASSTVTLSWQSDRPSPEIVVRSASSFSFAGVPGFGHSGGGICRFCLRYQYQRRFG